VRKNMPSAFWNPFKTKFCITAPERISLFHLSETGAICYRVFRAAFELIQIQCTSALLTDFRGRRNNNYMFVNSIYGATNCCCRDVARI
jgi:hypothetical protein